MTGEQVILLVDDSDDDAELTTLAFRAARLSNRILRMRDGVEALDYLNGRNSYAGRDVHDVPALVLLDINMPRLSGLEVLASIRATPHIAHVPVVVLTSSDEEKDRLAAYSQHANSYVRKPVSYDAFVAAAKELGLYWLVLNRPLPRRNA